MFFSEDGLCLELLGVFKIHRERSGLESKNQRGYDSISLRTEGAGHFKTEDARFTVGKGDFLYLPKSAKYTHKTNGETVYAIHFINYSFSAKNKPAVIKAKEVERAEALVAEMYREWAQQKRGFRHKCTSLLYSLLCLLNSQAQTEQTGAIDGSEKLKNAIHHIHTHFRRETLSVSELAAMCALSETYFRKLFKRIYATSPAHYVIDLRLEYASQLLASGLYTVTEASAKCGIPDTKYFSKLFKKRFDCSPRDYCDDSLNRREKDASLLSADGQTKN